MKKIIITNNLSFLKENLGNTDKKIAYYIMEESYESNLIREYFSLRRNCYAINNKNIINDEEFIKKYSAFIYRLNTENASFSWWAMDFTNKNPLLTNLCDNVRSYLLMIKSAKESFSEIIVIVSSNDAFRKQIRCWADKKGLGVSFFMRQRFNLKSIFYSMPVFFIIYAFIRAMLRKIMSWLFRERIRGVLQKDYIIVTQFVNRSFSRSGSFNDVYFGRLRQFFESKNKNFIICGYVNCAFRNIIRNARKSFKKEIIYPFEYFISFSSLLKCLAYSLFSYFMRRTKLQRNIEIDRENIFWIIKNEIDAAYKSGQIFVNLAVFYSMKNIVRLVHAQKILYLFENRSWEKMILLAAREASLGVKLAGYQHAALTPKHINFLMEDGETAKIPFPDEIIATGYIAKDILVDIFNFPEKLVKVGCALRQTLPQLDVLKSKTSEKSNRILLALASSIDEYVGLLRFLDLAFDKSLPYRLAIRPHPALDFKRALRIYCPRNIKYELDNSSLYDSLKNSDIVIYVSSTVSMEAISIGIPVINIRLEGVLDSDPMFNISYLKWVCRDPKELGQIIEDISRIDNITFMDMKNKARQFTELYFIGASEKMLGAFL